MNRIVTLPRATDSKYLANLQKIIKKEKVKFFIPTTEPELSVLLGKEKTLHNLHLITAGRKITSIGLDKWKTNQVLLRLGLPAPKTMLFSSKSLLKFPCILKNRIGSGSRGVTKVHSTKELSILARRLKKPILQELLLPENREVTCAVYRNREGKVACLQMLRRLAGGFTAWAQVIWNSEIQAMCEKIATGLNLRGSINVQMRITKKGPRVFEINPRFSSTVLMRHRFGFTDVLWAVAEAEGKTVVYPEIPNKGILVRIQDAAVLSS